MKSAPASRLDSKAASEKPRRTTMYSKEQTRRGLVIQGGGAKGAFALGCMKALREHGIEFSAVAGTSAGGLCAIIWSTGLLEEGVRAWREIDHSSFFGRRPEGCFRRLIKALCIAGKLFASYVKNVEPEGQRHYGRDIFFSLVVGAFAWLLLFGLLPLWIWLASVLCVPVIALFALTNNLPGIGGDNRVRELIVNTIAFVAATRLLVSLTWVALHSAGLVTMATNITWMQVIGTAAILAMMRLPIRIQTILMEGKFLATQISGFLSADLRIPTYVTVAEECPPNSPHFLVPTPGVFKAHYAALHEAPAELRAAFAYASAALPFGILPHIVIGGTTFVDGGVADNTPVLPMMREGVDELWIIYLQPASLDLPQHGRDVISQAIFAHGPTMPGDAYTVYERWLKRLKIVILAPRVSLGGLLTGTLNFSERRTHACLRHGYRVATRALRANHIGHASPPRIYNPRLGLLTRIRLVRRALPPCSLSRLFARSDAIQGLRDFHIPDSVRPPPGQEGSAAWFWSVIIVWALFAADGFLTGHPWKRLIWGTLIALVMIGFPNWWTRLKRNVGVTD